MGVSVRRARESGAGDQGSAPVEESFRLVTAGDCRGSTPRELSTHSHRKLFIIRSEMGFDTQKRNRTCSYQGALTSYDAQAFLPGQMMRGFSLIFFLAGKGKDARLELQDV